MGSEMCLHLSSPRGVPRRASRAGLRRARWGTSVAFLLTGFVFATWAARIPALKANLRLTDSQLANPDSLKALGVTCKVVGKVGMSGTSYLAVAQWFTATEHPPDHAPSPAWTNDPLPSHSTMSQVSSRNPTLREPLTASEHG
jgi:hypothetical protein